MTHRITMLIGAAAVVASVLAAQSQSQSQPRSSRGPPTPAPGRRSLREQPEPRRERLPAGRSGRRRQPGPGDRRRPARSTRAASIRPPGSTAPRSIRRPGRAGLEPGEDQDAAGRQGHRRDALRLDRSERLLRDGQRRLRLHLDRDAARPARLAGHGADVAHLRAGQGRARRAHRLHRRARDSARARCRRAGARRAHRGHGGGGARGRRLGLLPAAGPAQQRRRPGLRRGDVGRRCPAATATPSTTTSW